MLFIGLIVTKPVVKFTFKYILVPLNLGLAIWIFLMNHAFVHPTALPTSYPLRAHGYWRFTTLYMAMCTVSVLVGLTNVFVVYTAFKDEPRRMKRFRSCSTFSCCRQVPAYIIYSVFLLAVIGSYGLIACLGFRDMFAERAYTRACDGYSLMAEIYILPSFPSYNGPNDPTQDASARLTFWKDGSRQFTMDVIRGYNQSAGFQQYYAAGASHKNTTAEGWAGFDLTLLWTDSQLSQAADGQSYQTELEYFNMTKLFQYESQGSPFTVPGPIANVRYELINSTYAHKSSPDCRVG